MFNGIDLSFMQKKVVENPKVSIGAAAIGTLALIYAFSKSGSNDINEDEEDTLPDYAHRDIDFEFTQRFVKKNQQRRRTISSDNNSPNPNKLSRNNRSKIHKNKNKLQVNNEESKDEDTNTKLKDKNYSPFDPMNPNYSYDMEDDETHEEEEEEEGFSTDAYYVPFRIKGTKTKRRPDDPFMAMFKMYASKGSSADYEDYVNDNNDNTESKTNDNMINMMDDEDIDDDNDEEKGDEKEEEQQGQSEDKDIGSSPPLNPVIPSVSQQRQANGLGGLDSLRERYYKKQLPPSFQSSALADAFASSSQQAIQNDLAELEDKTLLGGIKQSVSMITQSND